MSENCLICGKDHPGKIRGGKVGRIQCFRLTPADRRERAKQRAQQWRDRRCPCGLIATRRHQRECPVWRMNHSDTTAIDAAMRGMGR